MTGRLIDEVATYMQAQGIGTVATDIFKSDMPDSPDACITLYESSGLPADIELPLHQPSFQIMIRAADFSTGATRTQSIRDLLHNLYNLQLVTNGTYIYACNLTGEGGHIGRDEKARDLFSLNFQCRVR